jgi:hypothetical protein
MASLSATRRLALGVALALPLALGCGGDGSGPLGQMAERLAPTPTPSPAPTPTPAPTPPSSNRLAVAGDVNFEDLDPEVVVFETDGRLRLELRHRVPGSASPDSTLVLLEVPPGGGAYRLVAPGAARGRGVVGALFTTRSERVGSMKDFDHAVSGTLTLREESPGVLSGSFQADLQEAPPPPPPPHKPGEPLPSMLGKVPPSPPARVQVGGALVAVLSTARTSPTPPPGAAVATPAPTPPPPVG